MTDDVRALLAQLLDVLVAWITGALTGPEASLAIAEIDDRLATATTMEDVR